MEVAVPPPGPERAPRRRVLVVEDDSDLRDTLAELLTARGHAVETAIDGRQALDSMRRSRPDVVVLDLMMPVMDGWEFRVEQKRDPVLADTPVVAYSASQMSSAAAVDADCYLKKPLDVGKVERAIEEVLANRERRREPARRAQTERLAALGTLAAGVAHEINNPLTYVLINLERAHRVLGQLGSGPRFEEVQTMLREALEGVERIKGVTSSIRDFSRIDRDEDGVPLDVRTVLDSALRLVANDIAQRGRLVKDYRSSGLILGSPGRLGQVFLNLLMNAVQAIPAGSSTAQHEVRLSTRNERGHIVVEVSDSGDGIPEHLIGHIFEPFFSTKPVGQGAGLGLSISHGIVHAMGGEITVQSRPGQGTTFRVALPLVRAVRLGAGSSPQVRPATARRRILLIDDEKALLGALGTAVGDNHEVVTALGGRAGLDILASDRRFDAILCDLHMPDVSGIYVYEHVAGVDPALARRMIFMSGGTFTGRAREFVAATPNACLEKPLDLNTLERLLSADDTNPFSGRA
jgi:signal transduction histidine kinase